MKCFFFLSYNTLSLILYIYC